MKNNFNCLNMLRAESQNRGKIKKTKIIATVKKAKPVLLYNKF